METTCDFEHTVPVKGLGTDMRIDANVAVQETEGSAANGRMTLRALLGIRLNAFETAEKELITDAEVTDARRRGNRRSAHPEAACRALPDSAAGRGQDARSGGIRSARAARRRRRTLRTGEAAVTELTGGAGRIGVCGTIEVRVLHKPKEAGNPLVTTAHEIPFEITLNADIPEGCSRLLPQS